MPCFQFVLLRKTAQLLLCLTSILLFSPSGQAQLNGQDQYFPPLLPDLLPPLQKSLFWLLEKHPASCFGISSGKDSQAQDLLLNDLYSDNGIHPYWVTEYGPQEKARVLLAVLAKADEDGLDTARYHLQEIAELLTAKDTDSLARLDIMLTLALSSYVQDMRLGRAAAYSKNIDITRLILKGLNSVDLAVFLTRQAPQHREYQALKKLLAEYRQLAVTGGWPQIPEGPILRPGMMDERLDLLALRLHLSGDLPTLPPPAHRDTASSPASSDETSEAAAPFNLPQPEPVQRLRIYDKELVKAVKRFQGRCNLEQDGTVGPNTLAALNVSADEQIKKILLNMERWRWLPRQLTTGRRLLVNIAGFDLTMLNNGQTELTMPVIVGDNKHKTPVFSHAVSYIEINPYWNIPPSIAHKEIVKKMQKDPGFLRKQRIRIFAGWEKNAPEISPAVINWRTVGANIRKYRLRQDPGKGNALGTIKFMFPNRSNIYLHDTPGQSLFQRARRNFSHGCIRVSRPFDLAWQILKDNGQVLSKETLRKRIASGKRAVFVLKQPVPVHIVYLTVRVAEDGTPHFYEDVYDRDTLLAEALFADEHSQQAAVAAPRGQK